MHVAVSNLNNHQRMYIMYMNNFCYKSFMFVYENLLNLINHRKLVKILTCNLIDRDELTGNSTKVTLQHKLVLEAKASV